MAKEIFCSISAKAVYKLGEPILLTFNVKNVSKNDLYILTWDTPLDQLFTNYINVKRERTYIPYDGILVKRGLPQQEDYILLKAGETYENKFDISESFNIKQSGNYTVTLN